jgi:fibronectin type 3 domain-containing protein
VLLPVGSDADPPTAPTGLTATASSAAISLGWTASTDNIGVANYRVERCQGAGCTTFAQIATPTAVTLSDTGLLASTSYSYRVSAVDPSGNVSGFSNVATATTPAAPVGPSGLVAGYTFDAGAGTVATDLSGNGNNGTISGATWVAGKFGGGLQFNGSGAVVQIPASASLNVGSAITMAAWIQPASIQSGWRTIMQKQADAYFLNASNSNGNNFPAGGATTGSATNVVSATSAAAVGAWTHVALTYDGSVMRLYVNGTQVATRNAGGVVQSTTSPLWIGGNQPYGEYFSGVIDEVEVYNRALSAAEIANAMANPLSPPVPDTTPPGAPAGLTATPSGAGQINLNWTAATDNVGVAGYAVERCLGANCTTFAQVGTSIGLTFNDTGLAASTSYSYRVRATDAAGNPGPFSNTATAMTSAAPDTTAPSTPAGLGATVVSSTQINLAWTASTDNVGVTGYQVERCTGSACTTWAQVGTPTTTTFNSTGLTASTVYRFRVRATDAAGNLSAYSGIVSATTQAAADVTAPSTPAGLAATAAGPTQVNLGWTASTDNVGVTGYRVERCTGSGCTTFTQIGTPTGPSFSDTTAAASTLYRYRVRATDAAGNLSGYSSVVNATTPAAPDTTAPSTPGGITATAAGLGITVAWTASTDNVGVAGYRVQRCTGAACTTFAQIATPAAPSYADSGLAPTTSYSYRVVAVDAAGNVSGYSAVASATTGATPVLPSGLVAGYSFNAGSGTSAVDSSGNANTGTLQGGTTWVTGKYGNAIQFDGVNGMVQVPSSTTLNVGGGFSLAAWVQPTATQSGWRTVMQRQVESYFLNASNSAGALFPAGGATIGSGQPVVSATSAMAVGVWTHLALTYDGSTVRLYVNGVQVATKTSGGTVQSSTNPLWIGGNVPYGEFFKGLIDEAQVYNRGLSAAEVQTVMNTPLT